jgi:hypothetical protein
MWVPGSMPYLIAGLALLAVWLRTAEGGVRWWESQALLRQPSSIMKSCIPGRQSRIGHDIA